MRISDWVIRLTPLPKYYVFELQVTSKYRSKGKSRNAQGMERIKKGMITHRKNVGIHCGGGGVVAGVAGDGRWLRRGLEVKKWFTTRLEEREKIANEEKAFKPEIKNNGTMLFHWLASSRSGAGRASGQDAEDLAARSAALSVAEIERKISRIFVSNSTECFKITTAP